jgi:hypothetical protein
MKSRRDTLSRLPIDALLGVLVLGWENRTIDAVPRYRARPAVSRVQ